MLPMLVGVPPKPRGLGEPQRAASEYRKRYSDALLAYDLVLEIKELIGCVSESHNNP